MLGYTVNFKCDNFQEISIKDTISLENENVIILLNGECDNLLREYYTNIRKLIVKTNKVIILDDNSHISNQISMLMCLYEKYDIYKVSNSLTGDYINTLLDREPTIEEVETFINADVAGYAELNNIILDLMDAVKSKDINRITDVLSDKINEIENFTGLIDYLRTMTNNIIDGSAGNSSRQLKEEIEQLKQQLQIKEDKINELNTNIIESRKSNTEYKAEIIKLNDKINKLSEVEPSLMAYNELQTRLINCKTKSVIYFKEVSPVNYINSFTVTLVEAIRKLKKLNVKFIVYDHKGAFLNIYRPPLQLITSNDYGSDRDRVVTSVKDMLLTEVNQSILQDILCDSKWDVVIIYDKLKQATDIVSGNIVSKYYVINSLKEFNVLEREYKVKENEIITRPGLLKDSLTISYSLECEQAKDETAKQSARLAFYFSKMRNMGSYTGRVFDAILEKSNITGIPPRK